MSLFRDILRDYLCRVTGQHDYCGGGAPMSIDDALAAAAVHTYRPGRGRTVGGGAGLLPGSTPEGILSSGPADALAPPVVTSATASGSLVGPPYQTEEIDQDEFRNVGVTSGAADYFIILGPQLTGDVDVLEMTFFPAGATTLQVIRDGTIISGAWPLAAGQPWSAPGLTILRQQALVLHVFSAVAVNFEVRWKWRV